MIKTYKTSFFSVDLITVEKLTNTKKVKEKKKKRKKPENLTNTTSHFFYTN